MPWPALRAARPVTVRGPDPGSLLGFLLSSFSRRSLGACGLPEATARLRVGSMLQPGSQEPMLQFPQHRARGQIELLPSRWPNLTDHAVCRPCVALAGGCRDGIERLLQLGNVFPRPAISGRPHRHNAAPLWPGASMQARRT